MSNERNSPKGLSKANVILTLIVSILTILALLKGMFTEYDLFDFGNNDRKGVKMDEVRNH